VTYADIQRARLLPWWERWPGVLEQELDQFASRGLPVVLLSDPRHGDGRLVVETSLNVPPHGEVRLVVIYPDGFPDRRFSVYAPDLRLGRHQAFGGNLCVMPRESAHWDPWFTAADIIVDRVPRLVELVEQGGEALREAEDPQGEPLTTYYSSPAQGGVIFDDRLVVDAIEAAGGGTLELRHVGGGAWLAPPPEQPPEGWAPPTGLIYLASATDQAGTKLTDEIPERLTGQFVAEGSGAWTFVSDPPYATSAEELWDYLVEADTHVANWAAHTNGLLIMGMCTREEVRQGEYELSWVFIARHADTIDQSKGPAGRRRSGNPARQQLRRYGQPIFVRGLRRTEDALAARIPELRGFRDKTVAVAGLGSLGAPVVQELTKARVGKLRLLDHDFVDPAAGVRHPLSLADAGVNKTLALARWAAANHPEVEVSMLPMQIGAAPLDGPGLTELNAMNDVLTGADLLISATAEHDVNRQLDTYARELDVPRLYLWSQSGYGGVVALLTSDTGCYHCLEVLLSDSAAAGAPLVAVPPDGPHGTPTGTIQSPGCADKTFVAPHADLLPIAIHAARVAYGLLSSGDSDGYPRMVGDVFTVQIREVDGTPIPPRWTATNLKANAACPNCKNF
jgi:molybdopterin/thiamine biosynthesis adenylyltransferase